jgi:hypothetical protein
MNPLTLSEPQSNTWTKNTHILSIVKLFNFINLLTVNTNYFTFDVEGWYRSRVCTINASPLIWYSNPEQFLQAGIGEARPVFTLYKLISFIYVWFSQVASLPFTFSYSTILYAFLTSPVSAICLTHLTCTWSSPCYGHEDCRRSQRDVHCLKLIQIPCTHFADVIEARG